VLKIVKIEWKPNNPCEDCSTERKYERNHIYGFSNECLCKDMYQYYYTISSLKTLLNYLKVVASNYAMPESYSEGVPVEELDSMLEQLSTIESNRKE
jgi:hypothetical protein